MPSPATPLALVATPESPPSGTGEVPAPPASAKAPTSPEPGVALTGPVRGPDPCAVAAPQPASSAEWAAWQRLLPGYLDAFPTDADALRRYGWHPVAQYLQHLQSEASRRTMQTSLRVVVEGWRGGSYTVVTFPWHTLTPAETRGVRPWLLARPGRSRRPSRGAAGGEGGPGRPGEAGETSAPPTLAPSTVNKALASLRGVLTECWRLGLYTAEEAARLKDLARATGDTPPTGRALTAGELRAMFAACADDASPRGPRDAALLAVLYGAGLRRAEAAGLTLGQVDLGQGALSVRGKGRKHRTVYLAAAAEAALRAWLALRRPLSDTPTGPLFVPVSRGGPRTPPRLILRRITEQTVYDVLARRAREARVDPFAPHDLRRTYVGDLLEAGADINVVSQLAGHASVTTTARYDRRGERAKHLASHLLHVPYTPHRPPR